MSVSSNLFRVNCLNTVLCSDNNFHLSGWYIVRLLNEWVSCVMFERDYVKCSLFIFMNFSLNLIEMY